MCPAFLRDVMPLALMGTAARILIKPAESRCSIALIKVVPRFGATDDTITLILSSQASALALPQMAIGMAAGVAP